MQKIEDAARNDEREGKLQESYAVNIQENLPFVRIGDKHILDLEKMAADGLDIRGKNVKLRNFYTADVFIYSAAFIVEFYDDIQARFAEIKKFGPYAVVIKNCQEFLSRVQSVLPQVQVGRVVYTNTPQTIFEKPLKYSLESELRFVTQGEKNSDKTLFKHVGSLQDIAYICDVSYFDNLAFAFELSKKSHL